MTGKGISVGQREWRRAAADVPAGPHGVHEIAHAENSADRIRRVALPLGRPRLWLLIPSAVQSFRATARAIYHAKSAC